MMMKIFGAALIISGGYLLGLLRTYQLKTRLKILRKIQRLFKAFDYELRAYRRSIDEFLSDKGELASDLLQNHPIKGLTQEDRLKIDSVMQRYKSKSLQGSIDAQEEILAYLDHNIKKSEEDIASSGKALPLVTGAIGLLTAVLLF